MPIFPALSLHSLGSFVLALACGAFKLGPKAVLSASFGAMIVSYGVLLLMPLKELHELDRLRAQFPLESVAERLKYEEQKTGRGTSLPALNREVEERLEKWDARAAYVGSRSWTLAALHNRTADDFVMAQGFGPIRMREVSQRRLELPESPPVTLPGLPDPEPTSASSEQPSVPLAMPQKTSQSRPSETALLTMHESGLEDFFDIERMGYIKDRDHVAGFEPHRCLAVPKLGDGEALKTQWQVVRLELVSLLKHDTPVAYVSQQLPQLDRLKDAPIRPLDAFERKAIDRLRADEDLVIEESRNRIRMVGSLRSTKTCLECHSVRRGELLGAFSYELAPVHPVPAPRNDATPRGPST